MPPTHTPLDELEELAVTEVRIAVASDPDHPDHQRARSLLSTPVITDADLEALGPELLTQWRDLLASAIALTERMVKPQGSEQ